MHLLYPIQRPDMVKRIKRRRQAAMQAKDLQSRRQHGEKLCGCAQLMVCASRLLPWSGCTPQAGLQACCSNAQSGPTVATLECSASSHTLNIKYNATHMSVKRACQHDRAVSRQKTRCHEHTQLQH